MQIRKEEEDNPGDIGEIYEAGMGNNAWTMKWRRICTAIQIPLVPRQAKTQ